MEYFGNKGEWSELYTFFKLLADGKLYSGDDNMNRNADKWFPILEIFRDDSANRNSYKVDHVKKKILISGQSIQMEIPQEQFKIQAQRLLGFIKGMVFTTESNEKIEEFMREIDCGKISAKSSDKADIRIVIHNLQNGTKPELGYSIKSKLGGDSTIINPSGDNTNFIYRINGLDETEAEDVVAFCNSLRFFKDKFEELYSLGASLEFVGVARNEFHNNLTMLDLGLEKIIAECLLLYYSGECRTIKQATAIISERDPLGINASTYTQPMYEYKIKQLLIAAALGMTAKKVWHGKFNANGGFIVVKQDGDIVCYHFFDRNDLEDYLFHSTRFDTPSTSRHHFGHIYKENGEYYMKLNLQVRYKD